MSNDAYALTELADATGIEARTIRSYIERGLLPSAQARGRGASYSAEHLTRLQVIQSLRRARPGISLSEIRILLQQITPEQIHKLASGSITAAIRAIDDFTQPSDDELTDRTTDEGEVSTPIQSDQSAHTLTGAERLLRLLHQVTGLTSPTPSSKMEGWQRIPVTPDIELSVRAEFAADQLAAFRDLAGLLRHLLEHPDALPTKGEE
jgi:DNA-binding transcriptional MerR regulator